MNCIEGMDKFDSEPVNQEIIFVVKMSSVGFPMSSLVDPFKKSLEYWQMVIQCDYLISALNLSSYRGQVFNFNLRSSVQSSFVSIFLDFSDNSTLAEQEHQSILPFCLTDIGGQ